MGTWQAPLYCTHATTSAPTVRNLRQAHDATASRMRPVTNGPRLGARSHRVERTARASTASPSSTSAPTATRIGARRRPRRCGGWRSRAVMMDPRPGPATSAAIVAVAQTWTSASRTPVRITGSASGSSTPRNSCQPRHPHAARRLDDVAVDLAHADVGVGDDRRQGEQHQRDQRGEPGPAVRAEVVGADRAERQDQQGGEHRDGPADVGDVDGERSRPCRCGRARARAAVRSRARSAKAVTVSRICWTASCADAALALPVAPSVKIHWKASTITVSALSSPRVHGVSDALHDHEQDVESDRQRDAQQAGGEDLGLEVGVEAVAATGCPGRRARRSCRPWRARPSRPSRPAARP